MFLSQRRINVVWFGLFPGAKKKVKRKWTICWIFHLWILQITDHLLIRRVGISACGSIPLNILNKKTKTKINKWIKTVYAACCTYPWPHVQDEACVTESNHPPAHTCICAHSHQVVKVECWHINLETFSLGKRMNNFTMPGGNRYSELQKCLSRCWKTYIQSRLEPTAVGPPEKSPDSAHATCFLHRNGVVLPRIGSIFEPSQ